MAVHPVAAAGFDQAADTYHASRPSYPADAVDWIASNLRLNATTTCLDLAAGTGIFTALLVQRETRVIAVEPVDGMRTVLRAQLPAVPCMAATAERLPLRDASIDACTIAQAFHWFDGAVSLQELRRVLKPGGRVAMFWNARDRSRPWVNEVWGVMDRVEKQAPWRNHDHVATADSQARREEELTDVEGFGPVHSHQFHHEQIVTPETVVQRVQGVSHVAVLETEAQRAVLDEVRGIIANHPDTAGATSLAIPYRVDCYWLERTS